jgi:hypothetical protein
MSKRAGLIVIVAAGILWGLSEIFLGDVFYKFDIPMRAASMTAIGLMLLVASRFAYDRPGSSTAVALLAGGLRCMVPHLYICHLTAIALEGLAFDATWTSLRAGEKESLKRAWLSASIGAFLGSVAFGFLGAYVFGFGRWVAAGPTGILAWTLRTGAFASVLLLGLVPVAGRIAAYLARKHTVPQT